MADAFGWVRDQVMMASGLDDLGIENAPRIYPGLKAVAFPLRTGERLVLSPHDRNTLVQMARTRKSRHRHIQALAEGEAVDLLGARPKKAQVWECNLIKAGRYFDIEAGQVGEQIGVAWGEPTRLFLYLVPA